MTNGTKDKSPFKSTLETKQSDKQKPPFPQPKEIKRSPEKTK